MKYVIGIGEALFDCLPEGRKLGGAPANFAYHVSQFGLNGCAISAIGADELGDEIVDTFEKVHLDHILPVVEQPTGTVKVTLDDMAESSLNLIHFLHSRIFSVQMMKINI